MKLSILIPTHNRPLLFERCLNSVLSQINENVEIIVNNDSSDIQEIEHKQVKYYYKKFENLSLIYKFLLNQSKGEYVYYLEDDDHLTEDFLKSLTFEYDMIVGNYMPTYKPKYIFECISMYKDSIMDSQDFMKNLNIRRLELSQHIFKKNTIEDFQFPMDNNIHNDIKLVLHAAKKSKTIKTSSKIFYYQTTDGKDNISFPDFKKELKISRTYNF